MIDAVNGVRDTAVRAPEPRTAPRRAAIEPPRPGTDILKYLDRARWPITYQWEGGRLHRQNSMLAYEMYRAGVFSGRWMQRWQEVTEAVVTVAGPVTVAD